MMDKSHCFMNVGDEHEYQQYYDFSKTYEGHPDAMPQKPKRQVVAKKQVDGEVPSSDQESGKEVEEWEDVDVEDDDNEFQDVDEEEEEDDDELKKHESHKSEPSFSVITDDQHQTPSKGDFTLVDGGQSSSAGNHAQTSSFQNISDRKDGSKFVEDSLSSIKGGETVDGRNKKRGMTKEEAMIGLKVKSAQLLETGEILLGNGKIIGARSLKYIYKQRFRLADSRESVVVNKLALEYRRIKAIANGEANPEAAIFKGKISQDVIE